MFFFSSQKLSFNSVSSDNRLGSRVIDILSLMISVQFDFFNFDAFPELGHVWGKWSLA